MKKMNNKIIIPLLTICATANLEAAEKAAKENFLFIVCDDLRTELNCYGLDVYTPNIDALAADGVQFNRAYCNIPVSGASRASFLTGTRPTKRKFYSWNCRADKDAANEITLQQRFKESGYTTISNGKIFHHQDEASAKYWDNILGTDTPTRMGFLSDENLKIMKSTGKRGNFYEAGKFEESKYIDHRIATKSIEDLRGLQKNKEPFLLCVGFIRPHLPFIVPQKYYDMYGESKVQVPDNYVLKQDNNIPAQALANWEELRTYSGIPQQGQLDIATAENVIRGYRAATSFVDAQIGRIIKELKRSGLDKTTTVILIGDNGWNLGEHGIWCKSCVMETSLNVPLIISSPKMLKKHVSDQIVELVDVYPTLCDIAKIDKSKQLEGESLLPLLTSKEAKSKGYAVSRWQNGFTLVQGNYFYTEWWKGNDQIVDRLLFDHKADPDENINVVDRAEYKTIAEELSLNLKKLRGANYGN